MLLRQLGAVAVVPAAVQQSQRAYCYCLYVRSCFEQTLAWTA